MIQATVVSPEEMMGEYGGSPEPIIATVQQQEEDSAEDLTKAFKTMFDAFSESIPQNNAQAKKSKNVFKKFADYIGSKQFKDDVNEKAEKYKVPPKQIAKNFFLKVLGIIGDILGIVVNTACSILDIAVTLLSNLLHGTIDIVNKAGNAIVSIITLNQSNNK